jgi:hypothetical protein
MPLASIIPAHAPAGSGEREKRVAFRVSLLDTYHDAGACRNQDVMGLFV